MTLPSLPLSSACTAQQTSVATFVAPTTVSTKRTSAFSSHPLLRPRRPRTSVKYSFPHHYHQCNFPNSSTTTVNSILPSAPSTETNQKSTSYTPTYTTQHSRSQSSSDKTKHAPTPAEESLALLEWSAITARVMGHTRTNLGNRHLLDMNISNHLYIPSTIIESKQLLQMTREARRLQRNFHVDLDLSPATDVSPFAMMASKDLILSTSDLLSVARTLRVARILRRDILDIKLPVSNVPNFYKLMYELKTVRDIENEIFKCIDENSGQLDENAHPQLRKVRDDIRNSTNEARSTLMSVMTEHSDAIQDRLITSRYDRFVIPVKVSHKSLFKQGVVHDASASGNTAFVEPKEVKGFNDRLRGLAARERAVVTEALRRLSQDVIKSAAHDIQIVCEVLAIIEASATRSRASVSYGGIDVELCEDDRNDNNNIDIFLPRLRHPMLMWAAVDKKRMIDMEKSRNKKKKSRKDNNNEIDNNKNSDRLEVHVEELPAWENAVVPVSYELKKGVRCVCVSGSNTGGKTSAIKTLGVTALLAKAGFFIPACPTQKLNMNENKNGDDDDGSDDNGEKRDERKVKMPYFDQVLADIGDDQSLVQSLSTFSGHVRRIKRILAASTRESLVLLDELGSGTDPAEGAALGMAVLKHLAVRRKARLTFATTHHGELKTLKYSDDENAHMFENASVEFDDVLMEPTYRLIWGIPGRSNAIAIAQRLGLDINVVNSARELLRPSDGNENRVDVEKMIRSLEEDKRIAEEERLSAEKSLKEVNRLKDDLSSRLERLKNKENEIRKEQKLQVGKEVDKAKEEIAKVIREMQQGGGSAQSASKATNKLKGIEYRSKSNNGIDGNENNTNSREITLENTDQVEIGDRVVVQGISDGEVEIVGKSSRKELMVAFGPMRMKVKIGDVIAWRKSKIRQQQNLSVKKKDRGNKNGRIIRTSANSIDVRGERVEEASMKIESAMDKALSMGALWIIHGHGTGRLKIGLRKFLHEHSMVQRLEDAQQSDGGSGVTIVYF